LKTKTFKENKINIITLGCSKNQVDSEEIASQLKHNTYEVVHNSDKRDANIVIINTCGFIETAKEESINTILQYTALKAKGKVQRVYAMGCLVQRYKEELSNEINGIDGWYGTFEMPALLKSLKTDFKKDLVGERVLSNPSHYAYLKISEGCNRTCSFCAIPLMRGTHKSKTIEEILTEAKSLVKQGVKEIILIAQELTYYGLDIYKKRTLAELLFRLNEIEGLRWIRLHYAYPSKFPLDVLDAIAQCDKVCKYLDIPLQHASDNVLSAMKRQITLQETLTLIHHIREKIPNVALRTSMLVGFPGETDEDFKQLCDFIQAVRFDRLGVFTYSHEENTSAYLLEDDVPHNIKVERANILMDIQERISEQLNSQKIETIQSVIFDRKDGNFFYGRTQYDSPEVDNEVIIENNGIKGIKIGELYDVFIEDCDAFDLYGKIV
jgi:ribosomal protein S12 methylthiotransferase